jgi:hypothetical protein
VSARTSPASSHTGGRLTIAATAPSHHGCPVAKAVTSAASPIVSHNPGRIIPTNSARRLFRSQTSCIARF